MPGDGAVEIFASHRVKPVRHMSAQRFANIDVLA
jgi:hypothetical protein